MYSKLGSCATFVVALLIVGCTTFAPIHDVNNQPVGRDLTEDQVQKAIKLGAGVAGWRIQDVNPGHILATYNIRVHTVIVDIRYDANSYSINYKDSREMKAYCSKDDKAKNQGLIVTGRASCPDGQDPAYIHGNYNDWIRSLDSAIAAAISTV